MNERTKGWSTKMFGTDDIKNLTVTTDDGTYFFLTKDEVANDKDAFNGYDPNERVRCENCGEDTNLYLAVDMDGLGDGELSCTWWCRWCLLDDANGTAGGVSGTWKLDKPST